MTEIELYNELQNVEGCFKKNGFANIRASQKAEWYNERLS